MGSLNIQDMQTTAGEWQRGYIFKFLVLSEPKSSLFVKPTGWNTSNADYYCMEADTPEIAPELLTLLWSGQWSNYAGPMHKDSTKEIPVKLRISQGFEAYDYFLAWQSLTGDRRTGAADTKANYIGKFAVRAYSVDKVTYSHTFVYYNAWVRKVSKYTYKKDSSDIMELDLMIPYDYWDVIVEKGSDQ